MKRSLKKLTFMALFIALGVSLGYLLAPVPNVELVTMTIFLAGYFFGIKEGFVIGLFTEALYSAFNPYGMAAPPIFIAQILAMGLAGMVGGLTARTHHSFSLINILKIGFIGFLLTLIFGVLTTLSYSLFTGLTGKKLILSFVYGFYFYLAHLLSNTLIFLFLVPPLIRAMSKLKWPSLTTQGIHS